MGDWASDWSHKVDRAIEQVEKTGNLPRVSAGSDGAAWVWIWRWGQNGSTAELRVRAQPDPLDEGAQFEVLSTAWLEDQRSTGLSRVLWAGYLPYYDERWGSLASELSRVVHDGGFFSPSAVQPTPRLA